MDRESPAQKITKYCFFAAILIYLITIVTFRAPGTLTTDEIWFFDIVSKKTTAELYSGFALAYGGAFWGILKLAYIALGIDVTRALFSLMLCAPLLICTLICSGKQRIALLVLWAGMPMAWWYGKIVSPDTLNVLIISLCAASTILKKERLAFFLLGMAVGIKLNAVAVAPFIIGYLYISNKTITTSRTLKLFALGALGLFIASPIFFIAPFEALSTLRQFSSAATNHVYMIKTISFVSNPTWDMIYTIGIFSSLVAMSGYLLIIAFGFIKKDYLILSSVLAMAASALILSTASSALGWYWLPFLVVFFISASSSEAAKNSYAVAAFGVLIALGNAPEAYRSAMVQIEHNDRMGKFSEYLPCITDQAEKLSNFGPVHLRSFSSFERKVAAATGGKILESGYPGSVGEATRATSQHDTFIVDSAVISAGLYPSLVSAPRICNGAFAVDKSNRPN